MEQLLGKLLGQYGGSTLCDELLYLCPTLATAEIDMELCQLLGTYSALENDLLKLCPTTSWR